MKRLFIVLQVEVDDDYDSSKIDKSLEKAIKDCNGAVIDSNIDEVD